MIYLTVVSLIWAFSFSLIKTRLPGLDPALVAWARLVIPIPLFLPFFRPRGLPVRLMARLILTGAVQYGLMYLAYLQAFRYLDAYQVALYTILTPIYVALLDDLCRRRFKPADFWAAVLAVGGAAVITYQRPAFRGILTGFLLVQLSNLCFAAGQIDYRNLRPRFRALKDREVYALLFLGGAMATGPAVTLAGSWGQFARLSLSEAGTLLYLGAVASGLGFFWWNKGAVQTSAGTLAVFNNLKIPLAVAVSLLVFGEEADPVRLILGGAVIVAGLLLARQSGGE
jgi:drug/metabolite transporter (DMT)-like permease